MIITTVQLCDFLNDSDPFVAMKAKGHDWYIEGDEADEGWADHVKMIAKTKRYRHIGDVNRLIDISNWELVFFEQGAEEELRMPMVKEVKAWLDAKSSRLVTLTVNGSDFEATLELLRAVPGVKLLYVHGST